jgi:branched-chain amino acid transport system permease protein
MSEFLQEVVGGLASGGVYAILALALVLIYRATRVVNFAQGQMAMFATFICWTLLGHGWPFWGAFAATVAIAFAGGVALERIVIRPFENAPVLTVVIVTAGLFYVFDGVARWKWGGDQKFFPSAFSTRPIRIGGVAFSINDFAVIGVSLGLVLALYLFFRFTKLGLGMRAAAIAPDSSRLVGVRVSWMLALGWGLAAALGAIAGMLDASPSFDQNFMQAILLYAFAGAALGGIDSPGGAVVGSLLLGVMVDLFGYYVDNDLRLPVALAVILLVLLFRPAGLFGRTALRKV